MPPSRGNAVVYGKITVSSEVESMDSVVKQLIRVLEVCGYPEKEKEKDNKKDLEELKKIINEGDFIGGEDIKSK
jgi:hypothetical protein